MFCSLLSGNHGNEIESMIWRNGERIHFQLARMKRLKDQVWPLLWAPICNANYWCEHRYVEIIQIDNSAQHKLVMSRDKRRSAFCAIQNSYCQYKQRVLLWNRWWLSVIVPRHSEHGGHTVAGRVLLHDKQSYWDKKITLIYIVLYTNTDCVKAALLC